MSELSFKRILVLLHAIWRPLSLPEEIYYLPYTTQDFSMFERMKFENFQGDLPAPLRIMPPTAMALLSPDVAEITIIPQRNALCIPRYHSFSLMMTKLNELIDITQSK